MSWSATSYYRIFVFFPLLVSLYPLFSGQLAVCRAAPLSYRCYASQALPSRPAHSDHGGGFSETTADKSGLLMSSWWPSRRLPKWQLSLADSISCRELAPEAISLSGWLLEVSARHVLPRDACERRLKGVHADAKANGPRVTRQKPKSTTLKGRNYFVGFAASR